MASKFMSVHFDKNFISASKLTSVEQAILQVQICLMPPLHQSHLLKGRQPNSGKNGLQAARFRNIVIAIVHVF